jgi:hypothetical protein
MIALGAVSCANFRLDLFYYSTRTACASPKFLTDTDAISWNLLKIYGP